MADKNIIKKFLPQHLRNYALKFDIPEDVLEEYYDLIQLILESKAIDTDEEKQNWINLLLQFQILFPCLKNTKNIMLYEIKSVSLHCSQAVFGFDSGSLLVTIPNVSFAA